MSQPISVQDTLRYLLNPDSQSGLLFDKDSYEIADSKRNNIIESRKMRSSSTLVFMYIAK